MRIRHTAALAALLCLVTAGCTTTSRGAPKPAPTNEASTADPTPSADGNDLPSDGAPKVQNPLEDTTAFEQAPCSTLTATQTQRLNIPAGGTQEEIPYGLGCEWRNPETRSEVKIGFLSKGDRGLSGVYATNERKPYAYFIPLPDIEGFPAVANDGEDRRPTGRCIIDVGVTDKLLVDVVVQLSQANVNEKDPCAAAKDVAEMALQTMKEA